MINNLNHAQRIETAVCFQISAHAAALGVGPLALQHAAIRRQQRESIRNLANDRRRR